MPSCFDMTCSNQLTVSPRLRGSDPYPCGSLTYRSVFIFPLLSYAIFALVSTFFTCLPQTFSLNFRWEEEENCLVRKAGERARPSGKSGRVGFYEMRKFVRDGKTFPRRGCRGEKGTLLVRAPGRSFLQGLFRGLKTAPQRGSSISFRRRRSKAWLAARWRTWPLLRPRLRSI